MIAGVMRLGDRRVQAIMTPRREVERQMTEDRTHRQSCLRHRDSGNPMS
jgi:CBS domain containing-hemolysin-like protein